MEVKIMERQFVKVAIPSANSAMKFRNRKSRLEAWLDGGSGEVSVKFTKGGKPYQR